MEREVDRQIDLTYRPGGGWKSKLKYYDGELESPEELNKSRQGGEFSLSKKIGAYNFKLLLEKYSPRLTEDDQVNFLRLPELSLEYRPRGPLSYRAVVGNYYEDRSGTKAYRLRAEARYRDSFFLPLNNYLRVEQKLNTSAYQVEDIEYNFIPNQQQSETKLRLRTNLTQNLTLNNNYSYQKYWGYTPFNFDQGEQKNKLINKLNYKLPPYLDLDLEAGYNFFNEQYLDLEAYLNFDPTSNWEIRSGLRYDINNQQFDDELLLKSNYKGERLEHNLGFEYDLNTNELKEIDNQLIYELDGDWGWYLESNVSIDYDYNQRLREANIQLNKKFHCRELKFSYDHLREEFTIQYSLELFPADPIGFTHKDDDLLFESTIEDRLKNNDL